MVRELRGKKEGGGLTRIYTVGYVSLFYLFFPPLTLSLYEMVYYYYITNAFEDYIKLVILIKSS